MKSKLYGVLTMLAATMVLALPALNAQSAIVADVPFNFYVGDKAMAAGHYQARSSSETLEVLQNRDNDAAAFLMKAVRIQAKHEQNPKLVFEKCGNQYFLAQVWDGDTGIQIPRSKHEKELLLGANGSAASPEIIVLAMNRN